MNGTSLPVVVSEIPGPRSRELAATLAAHECPAITARRSRRAELLTIDVDDPIVWDSALGSNVIDVDGNTYVDLTSGFGVALLGHNAPLVSDAVRAQSAKLVHAMGDAWPDATRIALLAELAAAAPGDLSVSILGLSGSDAIDAAVKTAVLATGKTRVLTFERSYHGLALGVLGLQGYKSAFTEPFAKLTHPDVVRVPFGCSASVLRDAMKGVGLVLVEPVQGRGGIHLAPDGWLAELARITRTAGALLAFDEIQTGMGRTGTPFWASRGVVPDLLCIGKALGNGHPISACMGTPKAMNAWAESTGEAIHTQTFLGHPLGCAAARALVAALPSTCASVKERGDALEASLTAAGGEVRGVGLMRAATFSGCDALATSRALMRRGFLALPAGADSLSFTPATTIVHDQLKALESALRTSLR